MNHDHYEFCQWAASDGETILGKNSFKEAATAHPRLYQVPEAIVKDTGSEIRSAGTG
jgi:hypothetical protein